MNYMAKNTVAYVVFRMRCLLSWCITIQHATFLLWLFWQIPKMLDLMRYHQQHSLTYIAKCSQPFYFSYLFRGSNCCPCFWCSPLFLISTIYISLFIPVYSWEWQAQLVSHFVYNRRAVTQRCSVKNALLKNFAKLARKHLCQSLFFNKVAYLGPATIWKKDSDTDVLLWILQKILKKPFYKEHPSWLLLTVLRQRMLVLIPNFSVSN